MTWRETSGVVCCQCGAADQRRSLPYRQTADLSTADLSDTSLGGTVPFQKKIDEDEDVDFPEYSRFLFSSWCQSDVGVPAGRHVVSVLQTLHVVSH